MRENYALELSESGEKSDGPVLFPRPSWGSGLRMAAVCRQLLVLPAKRGWQGDALLARISRFSTRLSTNNFHPDLQYGLQLLMTKG